MEKLNSSNPLFSKVETKNVRYSIEDNFLTFWFRFKYKYSHIIEIGGFKRQQLMNYIKENHLFHINFLKIGMTFKVDVAG